MAIYGVGVNDANYVVKISKTIGYVEGKRKTRRVWTCPYYTKWTGILERVYSEELQKKYPTYIGCTVCEEWKLFSNFKAWMEEQDWEGKELDKDLLVRGNKLYSPDTCIFVSLAVNIFMTENTANRGNWPIGVHWQKADGKFIAMCSNTFTKKQEYLGMFDCPEKAHRAWLTRKLELAKMLATEQDDPRVAKALVERYENYWRKGENDERIIRSTSS